MAGCAPEAAAENLAITGFDDLGFDAQKGAVGPALERVLLHVGATADAPARQVQHRRANQPERPPAPCVARIGVGCHAPHRDDEHPAVDEQAAPEHFEPEALVDDVERVELHSLEDEVVEDVEGEERCEEVRARIGVVDVVVVPDRAGEGVERQHRAADDVEVHLEIDAVVEELHLLGAAEPARQEFVLDVAFGLAEHGDQRHDHGQHRSAGYGVQR